jgi:hypothetical protein
LITWALFYIYFVALQMNITTLNHTRNEIAITTIK